MKIKNQEVWDEYKRNNTDGYGGAVITYAERWAGLMEAAITSGEQYDFAEVAERTSHEADVEGITGFMYGAAVHTLANVWEYGDTLRQWHNKEYGYDGEGTVNPAIINIEIPDSPE